jgi:hypothetical protein
MVSPPQPTEKKKKMTFFFDIHILITPLVSSNTSCKEKWMQIFKMLFGFRIVCQNVFGTDRYRHFNKKWQG